MAYVLLLEDNELNTKLVMHLLRMRGHELDGAAHAVTVMRKALRRRPDLVITGVQQPDVSGLSFVRWMRTTPELATVPIFVCTAYGVGEDLRVLMSGPDAYLRLPLAIGQFTDSVDALLEAGRRGTVSRKLVEAESGRRPVLLVPASPGSLALPAANLRRVGREVVEAASQREAAALAAGRRFDALVTDTGLTPADYRDGVKTDRGRWMHAVESVIRWTDPLDELNRFLAAHPDWREDRRWAA